MACHRQLLVTFQATWLVFVQVQGLQQPKIGMEGTSAAVVLGGTSFDENVDKRKADLYQEVASMPGGVVGSTVV